MYLTYYCCYYYTSINHIACMTGNEKVKLFKQCTDQRIWRAADKIKNIKKKFFCTFAVF